MANLFFFPKAPACSVVLVLVDDDRLCVAWIRELFAVLAVSAPTMMGWRLPLCLGYISLARSATA